MHELTKGENKMKALTTTLTIFVLALGLTLIGSNAAMAQDRGNGYTVRGFVDNDADGFNDLAPDADNDGIPNGQDPDYDRPLDGNGNQFGNGGNHDGDNMFQNWYRYMHRWFMGDPDMDRGEGPGHGYGPGEGDGYDGNGPHDGSGYGPGGDGDCDGDGPHGPGRP
jgi:hypothetical protein